MPDRGVESESCCAIMDDRIISQPPAHTYGMDDDDELYGPRGCRAALASMNPFFSWRDLTPSLWWSRASGGDASIANTGAVSWPAMFMHCRLCVL